MKCHADFPRHILLAALGGVFVLARGAWAEDCQNQIEIDVCKAGCTATSAACAALCDAASGVCWAGCQAAFGTCDLGCGACDLGCDICCAIPGCGCGDCRADCNDCRTGCDNARDDCEDGCRLDCDDCIFDCQRDCESICRPFKKIGETCIPIFDRCADGLVCWPLPQPGDTTRCVPSENANLFDDDVCRSYYSSGQANTAINLGNAMTYGIGSGAAIGVSFTEEQGAVYGEDGNYGCYVTQCVGGTSDAEIGAFATFGVYLNYGSVPGQSIAIVGEAGEGIVFSEIVVLSTAGALIGNVYALSIEASFFPVSVGVYDCTTIVDTVGTRAPDGSLTPVFDSPPTAVCMDTVVCADPLTCTASASIDMGSADPEGDPLTLSQSPPGPYALGEQMVTLTVRDSTNQSRSCSALVTVTDCTGPVVACPPDIVVAHVDSLDPVETGMPTAMDGCSDVDEMNFEDSGAAGECPVATVLTRTWTVTDVVGNASTCEQRIDILDPDSDGDLTLDCLDECAFLASDRPNGCPVPRPPDLDVDKDGLPNGQDNCPTVQNPDQADNDGDGLGDACESDGDGDGVPDPLDNCPAEANADQADSDSDRAGDACDQCPQDARKNAPGLCGCGSPDVDSDGDTVLDCNDDCPGTPAGVQVDDLGCPVAVEPPPTPEPADEDGDGVVDTLDQCPGTPAGTAVGADGCEADSPGEQPVPDADGDGVPDDVDECPNTPAAAAVDSAGCLPVVEPPQRPVNILPNLCGSMSSVMGMFVGFGLLAMGRRSRSWGKRR